MKRILIILGAGIVIVFICFVLVVNLWIGNTVKKNVKIAEEKYPGTAEDALIAFLLDTANSPRDRTHIAIWTLGQIQSEKAKPVLHELYKNDPEGKTCSGKHDSVLCQYEIYKALNAEKENWWPLHRKLN
ncbi:MAG TPA: HEAT repeat domain-containing protein [Draconibacterium sp.]|nr:HEAT repeat domain-containing protein [Draconibacterium sp.]